jgi:two-component system NarL family sensor kinase
MFKSGSALTMIISDNGKGFERQTLIVKTTGGNGLRNMETRARGMKGTLQIQSKPGGGTSILLSVPLP